MQLATRGAKNERKYRILWKAFKKFRPGRWNQMRLLPSGFKIAFWKDPRPWLHYLRILLPQPSASGKKRPQPRKYLRPISKMHLTLNSGVTDLLKMLIRQNVWRTALSRSTCALPLNLIWGFETTSNAAVLVLPGSQSGLFHRWIFPSYLSSAFFWPRHCIDPVIPLWNNTGTYRNRFANRTGYEGFIRRTTHESPVLHQPWRWIRRP